MFKNATVYRLTKHEDAFAQGPEALHQQIAAGAFLPCAPTQSESHGWVPPRGEGHGALYEKVGPHIVLKLQTEVRVLPSDSVKRALAARVKLVEEQTGRAPRGKQRKELKEDVTLDLLPKALTRRSTMAVWVDVDGGFLWVDSPSLARADAAVTRLCAALPGIVLGVVPTLLSHVGLMTMMLKDGGSGHFNVDRECELKQPDSEKASVKYRRHSLDTDEVRAHLAQGKVPVRLAMTWNGRVSFVLTDTGTLARLDFLDGVFDGSRSEGVDAFDADVAIFTGELQALLGDLLDELGGLVAPVSAPLVPEAA